MTAVRVTRLRSKGFRACLFVLYSAVALAFGSVSVSGVTLIVSANPTDGSDGQVYIESTNGWSRIVPQNGTNTAYLTALAGEELTIIGVANPGKFFDGWSGTASGGVADPDSDTTTLTVPSENFRTLYGDFADYSLEVYSDGNGIVNPAAVFNKTNYYASGANLNLDAVPNSGYAFDHWELNGATLPDPSGSTDPLSITMDDNKVYRARFTNVWVVKEADINGLNTATSVVEVADGDSYTASVPSVYVSSGAGRRQRCNGFHDGIGDFPATSAGTAYTVPNVEQDSSLVWRWTNEYSITIEPSANGTTDYGSGTNVWRDEGTIFRIEAVADAGYTLLKWRTNGYDVIPSSNEFYWVNNSPVTIQPQFAGVFTDGDEDGLPDAWEADFGLSTSSGAGVDHGANGDPDNDGLSNLTEYQLRQTNGSSPIVNCSPINWDTDGDGMDDYWERWRLGTNLTADGARAWLDDGTVSERNGADGNPDGDSMWSTISGYITTNIPLVNLMEWTGPDGEGPYTNHTTLPGGVAPDAWVNTLSKTVNRAITNPRNSSPNDGSRPTKRDTDDDGYDDGFEYSWDVWHQANTNTPIVADTNIWPAITNVVPFWSKDGATRRFHPNKVHVQPVGDPAVGPPDYDRWYNQDNAQIGDWFGDSSEYTASIFAEGGSTLYPVTRLYPPAGNPRWCTHPFMWDADGDGLPDGWEVSFGYDPWDDDSDDDGNDDGDDNPDGDFFAQNGDLKHYEVYSTNGYNPATGYDYIIGTPDNPNTAEFINREELVGNGGVDLGDDATNSVPTHPRKIDTDGDTIWDGWEFYVGLDPTVPGDSNEDGDNDGLDNWREFQSQATSSTNENALLFVTNWFNKLFPTDPNDDDTDHDQIDDGDEEAAFNYIVGMGQLVIVSTNSDDELNIYFQGNGLNPTSVDTDGDRLPDAWENSYPGAIDTNGFLTGGMDGTFSDALLDYDGDRLLNYQEYMAGAVYHWQYRYNDGTDAWTDGRGLYGYEPYDFFDTNLSQNAAMTGPGGLAPHTWDPNYIIGGTGVVFRFLGGATPLGGGLWFSTCDPSDIDTDADGMDDYWEVYHGLNPLFGIEDVVASKLSGDRVTAGVGTNTDFRTAPWIIGRPLADADRDGVLNLFESVQPGDFEPPYHHTDPSPAWVTDTSYQESFVNLYYWLGERFGDMYEWYFSDEVRRDVNPPAPPSYLFDFECNEGFDTDNDNLADLAEINDDSAVSPGSTSPIDSMSPIKRRALYLDGDSAIRSRLNHFHDVNELKQFTVEMWVRPENPASGSEQILIERVGLDPVNPDMGTRANFRMGLDAAGRPFAGFNGAGVQNLFEEALASQSAALDSNKWYHVACTYDGQYVGETWTGYLRLYVNGVIVGSSPSQQIPYDGWIGPPNPQNPGVGFWVPMALVAGASDENPEGWIEQGVNIWVGANANKTREQPELDKFFKGWIDEIRIWSGARTQEELAGSRKVRFSRSQVESFALPSGDGAARLRYVYDFDDLPDPDHSPTSPDGFAFLDPWKPAGYTGEPWWSNATNYHSFVYTDNDNWGYVPWIENRVIHSALDMARDTAYVDAEGSNNYPNASNPYGFSYVHGEHERLEYHPFVVAPENATVGQVVDPANNGHYPDMLPLRWAVADEDVELWDGGGAGTDPFDTDGDGLPDGWEEANGLDPNSSTGPNGAYGDIDTDGLNNLAEYLAGTDPLSFDTDGDGLGDYDSGVHPVAGGVTYGESYTDRDGMDDMWESQYPSAVSPLLYDAHLDPDDDGWDNYSEFMMKTDPSSDADHPRPTISGIVRYFGLRTGGSVALHAYDHPSMDGQPVLGSVGTGVEISATEMIGLGDGVTRVYSGQLQHGNIVEGSVRVRRLNPFWLTPDFDFSDQGGSWVFAPNYFSTVPGDDYVEFDYEIGEYTFSWPDGSPNNWGAPWGDDRIFIDYNWQDADPKSFSMTDLMQGDVYMFGFRDIDNDGAYTEGEPAGLLEGQPINLQWGDITDVVIGLTDDLPGYGRFAWNEVSGETEYEVGVQCYSADGRPWRIFERIVEAPRTYFHEGDYRYANEIGLEDYNNRIPTYRWFARDHEGNTIESEFFTIEYPSTLNAPTLNDPVGGEWIHARNQIRFTMDKETTEFDLEIRAGSEAGDIVLSDRYYRPFREQDGSYVFTPPLYAHDGSFTNQVYFWRVRAINPYSTSSWSPYRSFTLNVRDTVQGVYYIEGQIYYFGKLMNTNAPAGVAETSNIVVQAYTSSGFSGEPAAQIIMERARATAAVGDKGMFKLQGLTQGNYYIRAFIDQDGDKKLDDWESWGFVKDSESPYANDYEPRRIFLSDNTDGYELIIRDKDTDNDRLPDAWEYEKNGDLLTSGPGGVNGYTDKDNDGLSDMEEYGLSPMDTDPNNPDSDGDGITDFDEVYWNGSSHYDPYHLTISPNGTDLNAMSADTDGDGLKDGDEVHVHGTNPLMADSDGDGLPDGHELTLSWAPDGGRAPMGDEGLKTDPMNPDSDGDGIGDLLEIAAGSNPLDPDSGAHPGIGRVRANPDGKLIVEWDTWSNQNTVSVRYDVEFSPSLDRPSWASIGAVTAEGNANAARQIMDVERTNRFGYYRLKLSVEE